MDALTIQIRKLTALLQCLELIASELSKTEPGASLPAQPLLWAENMIREGHACFDRLGAAFSEWGPRVSGEATESVRTLLDTTSHVRRALALALRQAGKVARELAELDPYTHDVAAIATALEKAADAACGDGVEIGETIQN